MSIVTEKYFLRGDKMAYSLQKAAKDFEKRAKKLKVPMYKICAQSDLGYDIFCRWKSGKVKDCFISSLNKISDTLIRLEKK